jgi:hypothetical protein
MFVGDKGHDGGGGIILNRIKAEFDTGAQAEICRKSETAEGARHKQRKGNSFHFFLLKYEC